MGKEPDRLKLLVAIDYSDTSRRALAWAFRYALRVPCETHVLYVVDDAVGDVHSERARQRIEEELEQLAIEVEPQLEASLRVPADREAVLPLRRHVLRGRPAQTILGFAEKIGAETIVLGTHGRTGLSGILIGSVAEAVVRRAHCPVVVVKPAFAPA